MKKANIYQPEIWEKICDSFYEKHGTSEKPNYNGTNS